MNRSRSAILALVFLGCTYTADDAPLEDEDLASAQLAVTLETPYTIAASTAPLVNPYVVTIATSGSDTTGNGSASLPFKTLQKAHDHLQTYFATNPHRDVDVQVVPGGAYLNQRVDWRFALTSPYRIRIGPPANAATKPVFVGCTAWPVSNTHTQCATGTVPFINLWAPRVAIENLHIQYYWMAISAHSGATNGRITQNFFYYIGNNHASSMVRGETAISVLSSYYLIQGNQFRFLRNYGTDDDIYLHALYFKDRNAHHNEASYNNFEYVDGDPVKHRNYTTYNKVNYNNFYYTGIRCAAILDSPDGGECASWGNEARYNNYERLQDGTLASARDGFEFERVVTGSTTGACAPPTGVTQRNATSGNVVVTNMQDPN